MSDGRRESGPLIRVLIADDQPAAQLGVRVLLEREPGFQVIGASAASASEAVRIARAETPNVIVADMMSPGHDGLRLLKATRSQSDGRAPPPILVYTSVGNPILAALSLRLGARGFLSKNGPLEELPRAVRLVAGGELYLMDEHRERLANGKRRPPQGQKRTAAGLELLSPAEVQVLQHIAQGRETPEIARLMERGPKTVETYRSRIRAKLDLANSTELAQFAWRVLYDRRFVVPALGMWLRALTDAGPRDGWE